ncbi:MAG TPA: hypothetical protein CFH84_01005 [Sulfurimonas sp. UBA12504]|nr:MAG TPA: hypothetical protein CFH84_01005 [Sulfurimonas sp. UBA12504]
MPTISMFYGIIVRMYCAPNEHNPPHIHVYYNENRENRGQKLTMELAGSEVSFN